MDEKLLYYLSFSYFMGIGPIKLKALINYFGDIKTAYRAKKENINKVIGEKLTNKFIDFRRGFNPIKKLDELNKKKITVLYQTHPKYPQPLINIEDPPICLYTKGKINRFDFDQSNGEKFLAIVGTRNPTPYGEQVARMFASELSELGIVIVSGMAIGIDSIAHLSAIKNQGKTIAVLGCGVEIVYPAINRSLYNQIIEKSGWVISEFPPDQMVVKGLFIARNRIISGLSSGVLVVEGSKDSGTLITVRHAAGQGKEVFAPPAPITSKMSEAPNMLLKQGAKLVTNINDILDELRWKIIPQKQKKIEEELNEEERGVYKLIFDKPKLADEIANEVKKPISEILNLLSLLEIKGVVEKNNQGRYQITHQAF